MTFTHSQIQNYSQISAFLGSIIALSYIAGKQKQQYKNIFIQGHTAIGIFSVVLGGSIFKGSEVITTVFLGLNQIGQNLLNALIVIQIAESCKDSTRLTVALSIKAGSTLLVNTYIPQLFEIKGIGFQNLYFIIACIQFMSVFLIWNLYGDNEWENDQQAIRIAEYLKSLRVKDGSRWDFKLWGGICRLTIQRNGIVCMKLESEHEKQKTSFEEFLSYFRGGSE